MTPPWSTPPLVHSDSAHLRRARTSLGVLTTVSMPRVSASGMICRRESPGSSAALAKVLTTTFGITYGAHVF